MQKSQQFYSCQLKRFHFFGFFYGESALNTALNCPALKPDSWPKPFMNSQFLFFMQNSS